MILFQLCCFDCQGKMCNSSRKWKTFTVSWKNVFKFYSIGNQEHCEYRKREASLLSESLGSFCGVFACVCRFVVCGCLSEWYKPNNHHRQNYGYWFIKLFTFNFIDMLQNYCNVSQTYTTCCCVGYMLAYSKHLTVPSTLQHLAFR